MKLKAIRGHLKRIISFTFELQCKNHDNRFKSDASTELTTEQLKASRSGHKTLGNLRWITPIPLRRGANGDSTEAIRSL